MKGPTVVMSTTSRITTEKDAREASVCLDLLAAIKLDELNDVVLVCAGGTEVPANRFVLAARSPVFCKMLYGQFREAKSSTIALLGYSEVVVRAVVHFCTSHELFLVDSEPDSAIQQLVQLAQAADYLQLSVLSRLAEQKVKQSMASNPAACTSIVLETANRGSNLFSVALAMVECRPYVTLDSTALSTEKMEAVLKNPNIAAGEWFLFNQLARWYEHQLELSDDDESAQHVLKVARQLCKRYIQLAHIEPSHLLGTCQDTPWVDQTSIFEAISAQALQASRDKVWKVQCRGATTAIDRVLVEGAGTPNANGMYYRISMNRGSCADLYSKRETSSGQQYVYTLSRSNVRSASPPDHSDHMQQNNSEYRLFCSKFLTHRAVKSLQNMQATENVVPTFQPILQVVELLPPAANVPTPIRKYYRVRLSDGDQHMPGTLTPELNALIESGDLNELHVLQVLEFGVYTVHGCASMHVLKAVVVTTTPSYLFGAPVPLEDSANEEDTDEDDDDAEQSQQGLHNLYTCLSPASEIPNTGWQLDSQGHGPPPKCTWIPATEERRSRGANPRRCSSPSPKRANSDGSPRSSSPRTVAT